MSDAEARAWYGRAIRFGEGEAVSGADTCRHPVYEESEAHADSLLGAGYHIRPSDLGLDSGEHLHLRVTQVICEGSGWTTLGGVVLWVAPDRGFAPWNGVFFEVRPAAAGP